MALAEAHRDLEALPMLEELAKADPKDRVVQERLAVALVTKAATQKPAEASGSLKRARAILLGLKKTGPMSDLGEVLADGLPADGQFPTFSQRSAAETAMREGEAAFASRDFEAARRAYQKALSLDPTLYSASLYVGDTYFAQNRLKEARTWFQRTILIDANRETAHRYLGDTLVKLNLLDAARLAYIDAIIAEPYSRRPWMGLGNWGRAVGVKPQHLRAVPDELDSAEGWENDDPGKVRVKAPNGDALPHDGREHWHLYAETRATWHRDRFAQTYPGSAYRHSLAEEVDALRRVAQAINADVKAGRIKQPHACFSNLMQLQREGLLEAYVLFTRVDEGISKDYEEYRQKHRGELRRYLRKYVAPSGNPDRDEDLVI
ncbi:MAG: tetratricopeptide repeat protein [Isosphaeraceae bacterium]